MLDQYISGDVPGKIIWMALPIKNHSPLKSKVVSVYIPLNSDFTVERDFVYKIIRYPISNNLNGLDIFWASAMLELECSHVVQNKWPLA